MKKSLIVLIELSNSANNADEENLIPQNLYGCHVKVLRHLQVV